MKSSLKALHDGDVVVFMALMKDGSAIPVKQGILIGIDKEHEEIYMANLNMHPQNSKEILEELVKDLS